MPRSFRKSLAAIGAIALIACCATAASASAATSKGTPAPAIVSAVHCPSTVSMLVDRLTAIDTVINEYHITYLRYKALAGSAKTAYNRISVPQLKADCNRAVGVPAEKSLTKFIAAQNVWRQCLLAKDNCSKNVYNAPMQRLWNDAERYLEKATNNLAD